MKASSRCFDLKTLISNDLPRFAIDGPLLLDTFNFFQENPGIIKKAWVHSIAGKYNEWNILQSITSSAAAAQFHEVLAADSCFAAEFTCFDTTPNPKTLCWKAPNGPS